MCYNSNTMSSLDLQTNSRPTLSSPITTLALFSMDSVSEFCPQHITSLPTSLSLYLLTWNSHYSLTPDPYCPTLVPTTHASLHPSLSINMLSLLYVSPSSNID